MDRLPDILYAPVRRQREIVGPYFGRNKGTSRSNAEPVELLFIDW